jgi:outer membrane protein assembly factor BamE (lipoprotein component of BamABCDE complex)
MADVRSFRRGVVPAVLGLLVVTGTGCGMFSSAKAPAEAPAAPAPAAPPVSLREAGAQIADEAALKQLVQGKTTKADVRERFGIPQEVVLGPGVETFVYYRERSSGWVRRTTERVETLTIRFDAQGLLKDFEYRFAGK